jgi:hypothetical protein
MISCQICGLTIYEQGVCKPCQNYNSLKFKQRDKKLNLILNNNMIDKIYSYFK